MVSRFKLTPPKTPERDTHEACARALDALLLPPALWFTYPAGAAQLSPQQQARYARIGLKRGLPDIWVLYNGIWCIELKAHHGALSKTRVVRTRRGAPRILDGQADVFPRLIASGAVNAIAICRSVDDMLDQLTTWNIPLRARVIGQNAPTPPVETRRERERVQDGV